MEMLKWIDITACSELRTLQLADPVVMHEAGSITK